jgi:hypothetical protein
MTTKIAIARAPLFPKNSAVKIVMGRNLKAEKSLVNRTLNTANNGVRIPSPAALTSAKVNSCLVKGFDRESG